MNELLFSTFKKCLLIECYWYRIAALKLFALRLHSKIFEELKELLFRQATSIDILAFQKFKLKNVMLI